MIKGEEEEKQDYPGYGVKQVLEDRYLQKDTGRIERCEGLDARNTEWCNPTNNKTSNQVILQKKNK